MGTYLSKDEILSSELVTADVEAFGGTVLVSELPADVVQGWFQSGVLTMDESGTGADVDIGKIDMVRVASRVILDPDSHEPMLSRAEAKKLADKSFSGIQAVVMKAMEITNWGAAEEEEKN
jgi:hypothetical protein